MYDNTEKSQGPVSPEACRVKREFPELYGRLLIANEQISGSTLPILTGLIMLWVILCASIHQGWIEGIGHIPLVKLQSWLVYVSLGIVLFGVMMLYAHWRQPAIYRHHKAAIEAELSRIDHSVAWLVNQIRDEPQLEDVTEQICRDSAP